MSAGVWQTLLLRREGAAAIAGDVGAGQCGPVRAVEGLTVAANSVRRARRVQGLRPWRDGPGEDVRVALDAPPRRAAISSYAAAPGVTGGACGTGWYG